MVIVGTRHIHCSIPYPGFVLSKQYFGHSRWIYSFGFPHMLCIFITRQDGG